MLEGKLLGPDPKNVHICTCLDMCEWQPCPYAGKEKPEGCPYKEE